MNRRDWMDSGTKLFLAGVDELGDDMLGAQTALPGWTRRHLIAHVHYNAEALRRLTHWAATGLPSPMYDSRRQRAEEIEAGALLPAADLRGLVHESAAALATDLDSLSDREWAQEVRTAQGRIVAASEIPWLRAREVAVHAVDLGVSVGFGDLPEDLNIALAIDVINRRALAGEAVPIVEWLTGRTTQAPTLGPWL
jgi:maleylpyruvate isomerase